MSVRYSVCSVGLLSWISICLYSATLWQVLTDIRYFFGSISKNISQDYINVSEFTTKRDDNSSELESIPLLITRLLLQMMQSEVENVNCNQKRYIFVSFHYADTSQKLRPCGFQFKLLVTSTMLIKLNSRHWGVWQWQVHIVPKKVCFTQWYSSIRKIVVVAPIYSEKTTE